MRLQFLHHKVKPQSGLEINFNKCLPPSSLPAPSSGTGTYKTQPIFYPLILSIICFRVSRKVSYILCVMLKVVCPSSVALVHCPVNLHGVSLCHNAHCLLAEVATGAYLLSSMEKSSQYCIHCIESNAIMNQVQSCNEEFKRAALALGKLCIFCFVCFTEEFDKRLI